MKKFIALSVMAMFCAAFAGCGEKPTSEKIADKAAEGGNAIEKKIDDATKK